MTLTTDPREQFHSETTPLYFTDLSLLHFVLGPFDSFHTVSFY